LVLNNILRLKKIKKKLFEFGYFIFYLKPHKKLILLLIILFIIGGFITFCNPIITKNIFDNGINKKDLKLVSIMLFAQLSLYVGSSVSDLMKNWLLLKINNEFGLLILKNFLLKLMKLPIRFFDKKNIGDLQQRIYDHYRIQYFFTTTSVTFIVSIVNFFAFVAALAYFNKTILTIILSFSIMEIFWILYFQKKRSGIDYAKFYEMSDSQENIIEILGSMQEIKLNNGEEKKVEKWYKTQLKLMTLNVDLMKVDQKQLLGSSLLDQVQNIIISFISAYEVINDKMSLGMMVSIGVISGQLKSTINQFLYLIRSYQDASISVDRIMEIHKKKNEDEEDGEVAGDKITNLTINNIELRNVSYQYDENTSFVLKDICISIEKGKTIAIVGNSGSGKTTLLKLLLKYYKPTSGNIIVNDNCDLQKISTTWWYNICGIIMQEGHIFSDTIIENIAVNDKTIDMERIYEAAKIANIYDFVESLPIKWKTVIGANGVGISGGQRQRILIARAVYKRPEILFFDEGTSALDTENEKIIIENMERYFINKTKIIIAHRFSTIKNADKIIVLDNGEIVETGTHSELSALKGKYYRLLENQLHLNKTEENSLPVTSTI